MVRHWVPFLNLSLGLFLLGAVAAPTFTALGLEWPGRVLYTLYGFTCHQLPQRSYFLFGPRLVQTYSSDQLLAAGMDPVWPRQFLGSAAMGYKLGLAHRNTAIYSSLMVGGVLYTLLGRLRLGRRWHVSRRRYLAPWLFAVLLMTLDGGSHLMSELTGWGFRVDNAWLRLVTGEALPAPFYVGDGIGSFNWLMRTVTGVLVGLTTVYFVLPILRKELGGQPGAPRPGVTGHGAVVSGTSEMRS
ncbi:MAG: DUF2085 domain-containing protein [Anaerolineae bacterium]|nr:DUF2085 domain-containing protein [Anaerolineae bacterium]NIN97120.1 DUF2085 domain-containing protein [Anaerolineae bacterium]NIQ80093.1 DUF2085 domain-containing protein [Anaerolineae bacterium]